MSSFLGFGLGFRAPHFDSILENPKRVHWFEALSENFMGIEGHEFGARFRQLEKLRELYPVALHGVSLSIGSSDPLNWKYIQRLKTLADRIDPIIVSDHLCWTGVEGVNFHDLLPLPYTRQVAQYVSERILAVQDFLGRRIMMENVSSYAESAASEMTEWEFVSEVVRQADCSLLLDVNNVYVSGFNHGFDPKAYIEGIPLDRVRQIHLAGHRDCKTHLIDTHDTFVCDDVWKLFEWTWKKTGPVNTMIEWDDNIPDFLEVVNELDKARRLVEKKSDTARTQDISALV